MLGQCTVHSAQCTVYIISSIQAPHCKLSTVPKKELYGEEGDTDGLHEAQPRVVHRLPVDVVNL